MSMHAFKYTPPRQVQGPRNQYHKHSGERLCTSACHLGNRVNTSVTSVQSGDQPRVYIGFIDNTVIAAISPHFTEDGA